MRVRVLIADPDLRLLRHAFQSLRRGGYSVVVETVPEQARALILGWQPHVIIAPPNCLDAWERSNQIDIAGIMSNASLLVTGNVTDNSCPWRKWAMSGCELLLKPLIHSSQLCAAVEAAVEAMPKAAESAWK